MYNVVFRNISGSTSDGAITWGSHKDKAHFDAWYDEKMMTWYQVVEEGVSQERAIELCSTPEATAAVVVSKLRELGETLRRL